ncbi:MAG: helix-turn-helix domain-containing protein [Bacillota bacterium]
MINIKLEYTLDRVGMSLRQFGLRSGLRPNTLSELKNNKAKQISFETIDKILNTLNTISIERELNVEFTILDLIDYTFMEKNQE